MMTSKYNLDNADKCLNYIVEASNKEKFLPDSFNKL